VTQTAAAPVIRRQLLGLQPAADYRGTFAPDSPEPVDGGELPAGWEGLYFPFDAPLTALRPDGSPSEDGVLPAIDLPRRMYAGEDTVFHRPLVYGSLVEQRTSLAGLVRKQGRSGELVFADIERVYSVDGETAVTSVWHDVFLGPAAARALQPLPDEKWEHDETVTLDARQLFRFSAITFNTHRVHYDRAWAVDVEGLDDLLVHGPLTRILMLDAVARWRPGRRVASFGITSTAPVFAGRALRLVARDTVAAETAEGDAGLRSEVAGLDSAGAALARGAVTWHPTTDDRP
jgi:3-methylfumaryl-CoA hydratase